MTRVISILVAVAVGFVGWRLVVYWNHLKAAEASQQKSAASTATQLQNLPGLPVQLEPSLRMAEEKGGKALGEWLKAHGGLVEDPRKAWIELDYCQKIARDRPQEARKLFAEVKARVHERSPVWPRVKELEKSFE